MKQAFVSGGTRGIGRAIVLSLAKAGYEVGFCYHKSKKEADQLVLEVNQFSKAYAFCYDLSSTSSVHRLGEEIKKTLPELSLLVNNAGVSSYGLFQDADDLELERVLSVNFKSAFILTRELIGGMISEKKGRIINISSVWGQTGASCEVLYSASKAALIGFTKALAKELAPSGITVNCIAPGVVDTDMMSKFSDEEKKEIAEEIPAGRFASPCEIASLVCYLASDDASYVTGQVIGMNGGFYC